MATSTIKCSLSDWHSCALTGSYVTSSTINYCIQGKVMFFRAQVRPNQTISSAVGTVEIADSIGTFAAVIAYPVTLGTTVGVQNLEAWAMSGTKSFRVVGAMSANTNYYFGGIAILN